eukprot:Ihof_evm8s91 gene=Ihof_evmTU8s91
MSYVVRIVPMLADNYGYLIIDRLAKVAAAIDPVEPEKMLAAAKKEGVDITCILTTHSHWDHDGGNVEIAKKLPNAVIYGGKGDSAAAVMHEVGDGDSLKIGNINVNVLYTPCHTPGHVCYVATQNKDGPSAVFTGDTMFVAGCGNFNAGTPQQMYTALVEKICRLPSDTQVYVGHEYTTTNLEFASLVEPNNEAIKKKLNWAKACKAAGKPTIPSTVSDELATNPFVRVTESEVQKWANV